MQCEMVLRIQTNSTIVEIQPWNCCFWLSHRSYRTIYQDCSSVFAKEAEKYVSAP